MRVACLTALLCLCAAVAVADEAEPARHELREAWEMDYLYTLHEIETVASSTTFREPRKDGAENILTGGVTDKHDRTYEYSPTAFDEAGCTRIAVSVVKHHLERTEHPPGESGSRNTWNAEGPFTGAAWHEDWKTDHWKRSLTKAARSPWGEFPDELLKTMAVKRHSRMHFMLPDRAVAIDETWKPEARHILAGFKQFQRDDQSPELEIECKLAGADEARAVITMKWKAERLAPVKSDTGANWKQGVKVEIEGKATLTLNRKDRFVEKFESETTAKLEGELWNSTHWLPTESVVKTTRVVTTTRKKVESK